MTSTSARAATSALSQPQSTPRRSRAARVSGRREEAMSCAGLKRLHWSSASRIARPIVPTPISPTMNSARTNAQRQR
eukprot:2497720-Rhodomonas_salina.3